jgi:hypothetical protein
MLCFAHSRAITNTFFQMKDKYKTTWMHPRSKHWHLLDYVIVRCGDLQNVMVTRAMRGADCMTYHRLLRSKLRMTVRPADRPASNRRLNCKALESEDERHELRRRIAERLLEIPGPAAGPDLELDACWEMLRSSIFDAALETLGYAKRQHKDWFDDNSDEIHLLLDTQHRARDAASSNSGSAGLRRRWLDLRPDTQRTLRRIQNE